MNMEYKDSAPALKLYMLLLGSKAPGRNVEQHDFFFGIATSLTELVPAVRSFWREAGDKIHIDGWREVTNVDAHSVTIMRRKDTVDAADKKLFFINLGGYQENKLEEQHYTVLTVSSDKATAINTAKKTVFFRENRIEGALSHIDDKFG